MQMFSLPHDASRHFRHVIPLILKIWLISDREICLPKYILLVAQALPFFGEIVGEIFSLDAEQRVTVITLTRGDVSKQIIRALYNLI